jgi:hypothetical protein
MKDNAIKLLVLLNVALLASFVGGRFLTSSPDPNAAFAQNRRPGDYLMIPGEVTGGSTSVVYVIDTTNGWLGAMAYDDTVRRLETMPGKIDLATVFTQHGGGTIDDRAPDGQPPSNNNRGNRGRGY